MSTRSFKRLGRPKFRPLSNSFGRRWTVERQYGDRIPITKIFFVLGFLDDPFGSYRDCELPHHVTQRGNRREALFFQDGDHQVYRDLLAEQARKVGAEVWAYYLMPNCKGT
jgi:hypothetical protein